MKIREAATIIRRLPGMERRTVRGGRPVTEATPIGEALIASALYLGPRRRGKFVKLIEATARAKR